MQVKIEIETDPAVLDDAGELLSFIRIAEGPFTGVCFTFGELKVLDEAEGQVTFSYTVVKTPPSLNLDDPTLLHDFETTVTKVLYDILSSITQDDLSKDTP